MNIKIQPKTEYPIDEYSIAKIASSLNLDYQLAKILYLRGFCDENAVKNFLFPNESSFYDPFMMKGMDKAVQRLNQAIENGEKIIVYGDYDADGICASSILSLYLSSRGLDVLVHIPNRIGDGYGLNIDTLTRLIENEIPDLILTCDCGISCAKEVEFALDLGVDVIVTDHHEISGEIPDCVVVNPKQSDCNYPYNMLCGAGVALKLIEAIAGREVMLQYIDLACVATIADLVPLLDENRLIVQLGIKRLNERKNLGLNALFSALKLETVTSGDIAYKIAP
ncbi:MAG: DHH family phosphoesterase, partial [Clostridia bacterium]|nr:DHH family phosphoesterase [Clostridia bacterium]